MRYTYNQGGRHLPDITLTFVWLVKIADWVERHCALRMRKSTDGCNVTMVTMAEREGGSSPLDSNHGNRSGMDCGRNCIGDEHELKKMANKRHLMDVRG